MPNLIHCIEIIIARIKGFFYKGEQWVEKTHVVLNQSEDEWEATWVRRGHTMYQHRKASRIFRSNGVIYDADGYLFYETENDLKYGTLLNASESPKVVTSFPYTPQTTILPYGGWRHFLLALGAAWRDFWNLY